MSSFWCGGMHNFWAFNVSNSFPSAVSQTGEDSIKVVGNTVFQKELENKTQFPNNRGDIWLTKWLLWKAFHYLIASDKCTLGC